MDTSKYSGKFGRTYLAWVRAAASFIKFQEEMSKLVGTAGFEPATTIVQTVLKIETLFTGS